LFALLLVPRTAQAQTQYGAGVFFDRSVPVLGFDDRYASSEQFGVVFARKLSERTTLEFEYNHAKLTDGKIERKPFVWSVDRKEYTSPNAKSEFNLNSFLVNALVGLGNRKAEGIDLLPYVAVGCGFYDYQDRISGLIYPGQNAATLDPTVVMEPRADDHTALGTNAGLGMAIVQGRFGLDLRARYNVIIGDLRAMEAWGLDGVFPICTVDMRTSFKLFF
jgi:hypothetical protein